MMNQSAGTPNSILAVGAHPDDIEYGCGGYLQRFENVTGVVVTDGGNGRGADSEKRIEELEHSAKLLNYNLIRLGMEDTRVDTTALILHFDKLIESLKPGMILFHHGDDTHQDHRAVADAMVSACRSYPGNMFAYATPSSRRFEPSAFVELSNEEWKVKLEAIHAHVSQRKNPYLRNDVLQIQFLKWSTMYYRGRPVPVEPFVLLRSIMSKKGE